MIEERIVNGEKIVFDTERGGAVLQEIAPAPDAKAPQTGLDAKIEVKPIETIAPKPSETPPSETLPATDSTA